MSVKIDGSLSFAKIFRLFVYFSSIITVITVIIVAILKIPHSAALTVIFKL